MNRRNIAQNHQHTVDRMRKKMIQNKGGQKICLILLLLNQNQTVIPLLDSLKSIIDTISIIETELKNNTNNLIKSITDWCTNNNIIYKISTDQFKNIQYNKTNSIKLSKNKFPETDYFLVSELDFVWNISNFNKENLTQDKYDVIHTNDNYRSTRFLSAKINWICHLQTYEYWVDFNDKSNINGVLLDSLSIREELDIYKYDNKKSLLLENFNESNLSKFDKSRIKFYLSYVYRNLNMFEEAIQTSLKRIEDGGCDEEVYYSIYNIGMSYEEWGWKIKQCIEYINQEIKSEDELKYIEKWNLNNLPINDLLTENAKLFNQAMLHYKRAYEFRPSRSESLYNTVKLCRKLEIDQLYDLGYQTIYIGKKIKLPNDYLFINKDCYDYLFDYELIMISHLLENKNPEGKEAIIKLLNRNNLPNQITIDIKSKIHFYF